jgi:glyoxylase-like metal-dependent hydrolase (beta-lactamase superfamily II)
MKRIVDGVYEIGLGMVNAYLLETPEALVLIDTGFPKSTDAIPAAMQKRGHAPNALAHIVATHAHPDHIGSLAALVRANGAQTWMHRIDAPSAEHAADGCLNPCSACASRWSMGTRHAGARLQRIAKLDFGIACLRHGGPIMQDADRRFRATFA